MARRKADREDLLREATALRRRIELRLSNELEPVVCGFRSDGSLSLYLGPDPVYHFDAAGRLRRAFVKDRLYRTQATTLAELTRIRGPNRTQLRRRDLNREECRAFLAEVKRQLEHLAAALQGQQYQIRGQVPPEAEMIGELLPALCRIAAAGPALAPAVKGKR